MSDLIKVVHGKRTSIWLPLYKDGVPVEGKGIFIAPSGHSDRSLAIKIVCKDDDGSRVPWTGLSESKVKLLIRALAEGLREFEGVTHVDPT